MRQHNIEMNWRYRPIRLPKVLKSFSFLNYSVIRCYINGHTLFGLVISMFLCHQVLKGHDDHVITCLQFSGTRIVSGSDDNTLKVWSATTGKVQLNKL